MTLTHPAVLSALLIALAFMPVLLILLLGLLPRKLEDFGEIEIGNPLLLDDDASMNEPPLFEPLIHLTRTMEEPQLRSLMLGCRFLPVEKAAPILKRYLHSSDAELQLYAQGIMQDGQGKLQSRFADMQVLAKPDAPASTASFLAAGLRLLDSPLTPESERSAIFAKLRGPAEATLATEVTHPRLAFEAGRYCIRIDNLDDAGRMLTSLPKGSPLQATLRTLLDHRLNILDPMSPLSERYDIH
jgi:hypothetical protein